MIEARLDHFLTECKYCHAQVVWADGPGEERIPFDVDPGAVHEKGNWALTIVPAKSMGPNVRGIHAPRLTAAQPTEGQARGMQAAGVVLYSHHALHCPEADKWHKVGTHGKATRRARGGRR
jgi:hypothetical protein